MWAAQKLRHDFLAYPVKLLARMDPLKYLFEKSVITGRTARWQLLLSEFDSTYVTQKSIKGQAVADHLAVQPIDTDEPVRPAQQAPDEDILSPMYLDSRSPELDSLNGWSNAPTVDCSFRLDPWSSHIMTNGTGLKALSFCLVDIGSPDVSEHRFAQRAVTKRKPIEPPLKLAQAPEMNEEW